jgi:hypothetical protein
MHLEAPTNLLIYRNDKVIVFTHNKVCSRICDAFFENTGWSVHLDFHDDIYDITGSPMFFDENEKKQFDITIHEEINLALNGKTKKDIIFLYRNPIDRWISGTLQEFYSLIETPQLAFLWCKQFKNDNLYNWLNNRLDNFSNPNGDNHSLEIPEDLEQDLKILVKDYFDSLSQTGYCQGHSTNFLHLYTLLLAIGKYDKNKLKLLDIGKNDVLPTLKKYVSFKSEKTEEVLSRSKESYSNKAFKNIFYNTFESYTDRKIVHLKDILKTEIAHYNFLSCHPNNIGTKIKT